MRQPLIWLIALAGLIFYSPASGEDNPDCIQIFDQGRINWSTGEVSAKGSAPPEKQTDGSLVAVPGSARAKATRNIIQILKQIRITPSMTVGQYASSHDIILAGIEKTAQDAVTTQQLYTSALDVEIRVKTHIFGGFLQLVLPDHIRQIPIISDQKSKSGKTQKDVQPDQSLNRDLHTGLIIDARGLDLPPLLYPTILSEQGKEIYSSLFISREFAVQYGVCAYSCDMEAAVSSSRIGNNPLIFKALRKEGSKGGSLIISMADAKALEKVTERHKFLKECRVIILTGP